MEICSVGGFEEVGKNMTAIKIGEDVFLFDAGVHLPAVIEMQEAGQQTYSEKQLRKSGGIPNDLVLDELGWRDKVRAIIIGHAHLDHIGAVPYIAHRYPKAEIIGSPFSMIFLETIIKDEKLRVNNKRTTVKENSTITLKGKSDTYKLDFIHTTHSTIQCSFLALHTKEGIFFYALDFKLDNHPVLGNPPNYKKLREIGNKGVKLLVVNAMESGREGRTPSERIVRNLLEDAFSYARGKKSALFVTTFSSHIARLKSIVDFGQKTNRKIIFLGRSLSKYIECATKVNMCPFRNKIQLVKYRGQVNSVLKKVEQNRGKYLIVCTGHQAEENSILDRIVKGDTPFKFRPKDNLIFSSKTIPVPINLAAREKLDKKLNKQGVRLQKNIHVSGHCSREDLRDLMEILKPEHIIPSHGSTQQLTPMIELARELGYKASKGCHLMQDGQSIEL